MLEPYLCDTYEIRPLHSVRRNLSGRFVLANLTPRVALDHVCYWRAFAIRIAAAACLCCLLLQQIGAAAAAAAYHGLLLLLHVVCCYCK